MLVLRLSNKGDTIVEVLLALAVLGAIIVGGYSIATRSLNGVRVAQERGEATKIAEGQIESLKAYLNDIKTQNELIKIDEIPTTVDPFAAILTDPNFKIPVGGTEQWGVVFGVPTPAGYKLPFCFDAAGDIKRYDFSGKTDDQFDQYPNECKFGVIYNQLYHVQITTEPYGAAGDPVTPFLYTVKVTWPRSGGGDAQQVIMQDRFLLAP